MTERERLRQELSVLGVKEGDAVLVHSSMKALGTKLSPEEVIDVLQEAVGESGTLLMPALTYENVCGEHRVFDSGTTPPCVGLLPRVFWRQPGVERSLHPTHSVCARGALAHRLTVGHQMDDTAVGPHSPFMQLAVVGGKLLFIGDILEACTFMHGIEDIVRPPWLRCGPKSSYTVDGAERRSAGFGEGTPQQVADQGNKRVERNLGHGSILALTV